MTFTKRSMARFAAVLVLVLASAASAQSLYQYQPRTTGWLSPENRSGEPGKGALENKGAKGHAFDTLPAGA